MRVRVNVSVTVGVMGKIRARAGVGGRGWDEV